MKPNCPFELLASKAAVDTLAITQLTTIAHSLPGIVHAVGQPDLHPGTKLPIGAVFMSKVIDIWHSNVKRVPWPPSCPSPSVPELDQATAKLTLGDISKSQEYVYIHREGAAPTTDRFTQQPLALLPLPGFRGTSTLIVSPTFPTSTSWSMRNALSLAHGAGRSMSCAKALSSVSQKYRGQNILEPKSGDAEGTWVVCEEKDLVFKEAPNACKNIQAVGQDLDDSSIATVVG